MGKKSKNKDNARNEKNNSLKKNKSNGMESVKSKSEGK